MTTPEGLAVIGFAGLGNMGTPMAARLVEAGHRVLGFDPLPDARERLRERGGEPVDDVVALAAARVVILMLPNSAVVRSVLLEQGLADALGAGTTVVDMSSSEPTATKELAVELAARGIALVDAPVSGGVKGAVAGTLTIMVGGTDADTAAVQPVLELLGRPRRVGPVGAGHALKALNNLLSATHLWVTSEALVAGQRFGLDPAVMLDAINGSSGRSASTENKWPNFILTERYDSGFGLRLMLKDMRIATGLAEQLGAPSVLGAAAVERWAAAAEDLPATADHTEIARWIAEHAQTD